MVIGYMRAFYYQSLPQCPLPRCPLPRFQRPRFSVRRRKNLSSLKHALLFYCTLCSDFLCGSNDAVSRHVSIAQIIRNATSHSRKEFWIRKQRKSTWPRRLVKSSSCWRVLGAATPPRSSLGQQGTGNPVPVLLEPGLWSTAGTLDKLLAHSTGSHRGFTVWLSCHNTPTVLVVVAAVDLYRVRQKSIAP